jgi:hypothetical protein
LVLLLGLMLLQVLVWVLALVNLSELGLVLVQGWAWVNLSDQGLESGLAWVMVLELLLDLVLELA